MRRRCLQSYLILLVFTSTLLQMSVFVQALGVVICGPSGVGKGSIISSICKIFPTKTALSVSHTSRRPRSGELDGIHYHFVSKDEMLQGIDEGNFLEHAKVHGNVYGTSKAAVDAILQENRIPLLDIDVEGVKQMKAIGSNFKYVFVAPPSFQDLESRLRGRSTETLSDINLRLENAKKELEYGTEANFDYILVNDELHLATRKLTQKLTTWYPKHFNDKS